MLNPFRHRPTIPNPAVPYEVALYAQPVTRRAEESRPSLPSRRRGEPLTYVPATDSWIYTPNR